MIPKNNSILYQVMSLPMNARLVAPNGVEYTQPLGLFINNEFVPAQSQDRITAVNPQYVPMTTRPARWEANSRK